MRKRWIVGGIAAVLLGISGTGLALNSGWLGGRWDASHAATGLATELQKLSSVQSAEADYSPLGLPNPTMKVAVTFNANATPAQLRQSRLIRLGQLQDALLRNARFVVSIKLHTGQITFDQAVDFFVNEGYQSRSIGLMETKRGTADALYLYYNLGKLQILKLRADMEKKQGAAFSLQQFHDEFLKQGPAPIKIIRRNMLHDSSPTL